MHKAFNAKKVFAFALNSKVIKRKHGVFVKKDNNSSNSNLLSESLKC